MHDSTYFPAEYPAYISENSLLEEYARPGHAKWTDREISEIREVLQKLTAIRILNPTDAEDLVQDTLLTLITRYPACELEKGLLVWSMGILRKKVGNYYRKMQRFTLIGEREFGVREPFRAGGRHESPEARVSHRELQDLIQKMMAQFPPAQRCAIELLLAGLDSGEIVEQLHPERYQNVINHIYRGRKKLAKELAKYGYGPGTGLRKMKRSGRRRITNYE